MITAQEAREIAGPTLEEKVESIGRSIQRLAGENKRCLRTGYDHSDDADLWINGGYGQTKEWKEAAKLLEKNGFKVTFYYSEGSMAVDMYTLIEW